MRYGTGACLRPAIALVEQRPCEAAGSDSRIRVMQPGEVWGATLFGALRRGVENGPEVWRGLARNLVGIAIPELGLRRESVQPALFDAVEPDLGIKRCSSKTEPFKTGSGRILGIPNTPTPRSQHVAKPDARLPSVNACSISRAYVQEAVALILSLSPRRSMQTCGTQDAHRLACTKQQHESRCRRDPIRQTPMTHRHAYSSRSPHRGTHIYKCVPRPYDDSKHNALARLQSDILYDCGLGGLAAYGSQTKATRMLQTSCSPYVPVSIHGEPGDLRVLPKCSQKMTNELLRVLADNSAKFGRTLGNNWQNVTNIWPNMVDVGRSWPWPNLANLGQFSGNVHRCWPTMADLNQCLAKFRPCLVEFGLVLNAWST